MPLGGLDLGAAGAVCVVQSGSQVPVPGGQHYDVVQAGAGHVDQSQSAQHVDALLPTCLPDRDHAVAPVVPVVGQGMQVHAHGGGVATDPSLGLLQVALVGDGVVLQDRLATEDLHPGDLGDTVILLVGG